MAVPFDRVVIGDVVTTETIAAIGQSVPPPAAETLDYSGKLILPGLVDGHMRTSSVLGWAGIEGAGGMTTCMDMPYDGRFIKRPAH